MSNDDYDEISDMAQNLMWTGFNAFAMREALQVDIDQFDDILQIPEKDISDLEYS